MCPKLRIAGLRARGRFFWLDVSLSETTLDELCEALDLSEAAIRALRRSADGHAPRTFHADGESVVFVLRCYVESETPADEAAYRLRPLKVYVLVTGEYLVTLHDERVSLPAVLAPDLPEERSKRYAVYSVVDAMLATTFEALEGLIERVAAHPTISRDANPRLAELTPREREVLELLAQGLSNAEIADALTLERTTVKTHVQRILTKLGARNRVEIVIVAYEWGLITPGHTTRGVHLGPHS